MSGKQIWERSATFKEKLRMNRIYYPWIDKTNSLSDLRFKEELRKVKGEEWFMREFPPRFHQLRGEIPVMVNQQGNLVTIPHTQDPITFGIVGKRGSGKTIMLNALCGRMYWYWKNGGFPNLQCGIMNDVNNETGAWSMPSTFHPELLGALNETPTPLPIVKVYPMTNTLRVLEASSKIPSIKIGIPFKEFVSHPEDFIKLDKSQSHFRQVAEDLSNCQSMDECYGVIHGSEMPKNSQNKIISLMYELWDEKIFDLDTEAIAQVDIHNGYTNESEVLNPFLALMVSNLIPTIQSRDIQGKYYSEKYFDYIVKDMFKYQYTSSGKPKQELVLFVDELNQISKKKNTNSTLQSLISETRTLRLGLVWCGQNPTKIADKILSNTKYMLCLQNSRKEIDHVANVFDMSEQQKNQVSTFSPLDGLLLTTGVFHIYDQLDNVWYESKEPQVGKILTPLSNSKPPMVK